MKIMNSDKISVLSYRKINNFKYTSFSQKRKYKLKMKTVENI